MAKNEEVVQPRWQLAIGWPTLLSLLTAFVAAGSVTLHLIGDVSHRRYLSHWGIDSGLFPKSTDWILINGYYGVVDRFLSILGAMLGNLHWLAATAVILGLYVFVLLSPASGGAGEAPAWLIRQPEWRRRFIRQMLLTGAFVCVVPCALFLLIGFMAVPAALGEIAGLAAATKASAEHSKGCEKSEIPCVDLRRGSETVASGFILDSTSSRIAIFDTKLLRGRVLDIGGLEVVSSRQPGRK